MGKDLSLLGMIFLLGENVPTWWPCPAGSWTVLCRNHTTIGLGACARQHLASNNGGCVQYQVLEVEFLVFQGQTSHLYPPNSQHKTGRELSNLCEVLYLLSKLLTRWLRESPSTSFCLSVSSVHEDPASGLAQVQSCGKEGGECFLSLTRRGDRFVLASAHIAAGMPSLERVLHASARWHRSGAGVAQASCTSTNWWWRSRRAEEAQPSITASGFRWIPVWRESASLASRFSLGMSFWSPVIAAPWRKSEQRRKGKQLNWRKRQCRR